uniref:Uncharacterized protein n=1 Tax=Anguilla anguilla TaxID=7936 RepID=A0A0E9S5Q1_ANGAN
MIMMANVPKHILEQGTTQETRDPSERA